MFRPYVDPHTKISEFTPRAIILGMLLGLVAVLFSIIKRIDSRQQTLDRGLLSSPGLIAGDACTSIVIAL